jgi:hypothetical protein
MRGLDPRIHDELPLEKTYERFPDSKRIVDCRVKPGNDRVDKLLPRLLMEELIYLSRGLRINSRHLGEVGQARALDRFHSAEMA